MAAKMALKLNFKTASSDSLTLSGTLPVPASFSPNGKSLTVVFGGYESQFTLNSKGQAVHGSDAIKLTGKHDKTGAFTASPVKFLYTVKKQNLFTALQSYGFTNADVSSQTLSVPLLVDLDSQGYVATVKATYKAKKGQSGSAK